MVLYSDATLDYIAGRCCMVNGIYYRGHSLICESIEKAMKSIYFVENESAHKAKHNLGSIKKDIKNNKFLNKYDKLLSFLTDAHKTRYAESVANFPQPHSSVYTSKDYLEEIDFLWLDIFDNLPMPDDIKFRIAWFIPSLITKNQSFYVWITVGNKAISPRLENLIKRGLEILNPPNNLIREDLL